jgi:hypothetical protein
VAVVPHDGGTLSDATLSEFSNPEKIGVMVGTAPPYVIVGLDAVTTNGAGFTVKSPVAPV